MEGERAVKEMKEEYVDSWLDQQSRMDEIDARPPSACSETRHDAEAYFAANGMDEDVLPQYNKEPSEQDHGESKVYS